MARSVARWSIRQWASRRDARSAQLEHDRRRTDAAARSGRTGLRAEERASENPEHVTRCDRHRTDADRTDRGDDEQGDEHRFVVAAKHGQRGILGQSRKHQIEDAARIGTAIDQIAEQDQVVDRAGAGGTCMACVCPARRA